jgi:hypothetical protein
VAEADGEARHQLVGKHPAHLARNPGKHRAPPPAVVLEPYARRGPVAIRENGGASRDHDLAAVREWNVAAPALLPQRPQCLPTVLVRHELAPEQLGDGRARAIVAGGPEAAGRDDGTGTVERFSNGSGNVRCIVADGRAADDRDANRRELACEVRRIGVDGVAEEQFVANGDQFHIHGTKASDRLPSQSW